MTDERQQVIKHNAARQLTGEVLRRCGSDPAEVVLLAEESALTRFANNAIHQNVAERDLTLHLRLLTGQRSGTASTNRTDPAALDELAALARANAQASPEDPNRPGLAEPAGYAEIECFDEGTVAFTPQWRAEAVGIVCRKAKDKGLNASGAFSTSAHAVTVANSLGLFAFHAYTQADFQATVMSEDSSGRARASGWKVSELPVEALGDEAIGKADRGRNPIPLQSGEYCVVFDPYVTNDLLDNLNLYGMGSQSVLEGRSWMNGRIGQQAMNQKVSIWDDGLDPGGLPLPFDYEGVPRKRVEIVTRGVVQGTVYDRYTARKAQAREGGVSQAGGSSMGPTSTGHAPSPGGFIWVRALGPVPLHLFMAPGDSSLEQMIRSTQRGLYITRFWYTRLVHPRDCVVTGMTRDGVFMIENGELAYPVKNLRFTQSYVQALAEVEAISQQTRLFENDFAAGGMRVPALKISRFNFTGVTA